MLGRSRLRSSQIVLHNLLYDVAEVTNPIAAVEPVNRRIVRHVIV